VQARLEALFQSTILPTFPELFESAAMPSQVESQPDSWSIASSFGFGAEKSEATDPADELLDLLENGYARESVTQECLTPRDPEDHERESGRPHRCFCFKRIGKEMMELHTDLGRSSVDRFLLSAKKVGDTFYISPYKFEEDANKNKIETMRRCAVLKKVPYGASGHCYKLFLDGCEGCDRNQIYEGVCDDANLPHHENKLLAEIWHSMTTIEGAETIMRSLRVTLPAKVKGSVRDQWETCSNSSSGSDDDSSAVEPISLCTKLPVWNKRTGNMTQKFHGNRVKRSSAKNIILTTDKLTPRKDQTSAMQFGKKGKSEYILDHTSPLSTLQAFAVALSMCAWMGDQ